MIPFFFDTETYLIRPGRQAPRVVCVQSRVAGEDLLESREDGIARIECVLRDPSRVLVGHNVAFDALATIATHPSLLPLWLDAYDADRVTCTQTRERLIRIADGTLTRHPDTSLIACIKHYGIKSAHVDGDKTGADSWRLRYAELDGLPVSEYPEDAVRYALADLAVADVYDAQEHHAPLLQDQYRQARAGFWLALTSAWGMRVDPVTVGKFRAKLEEEHSQVRARLTAAGLLDATGKKRTKVAAARMVEICGLRGFDVLKTDKGGIKLDADSCDGSGDDILRDYARYVSIGTLRSRARRLAAAGAASLPIQPRFTVLVETGRTSCSAGAVKPGQPMLAYGDQTQNLHRLPGLRECYTARPGCVLISVDWRAAELHTLAQTNLDLFGYARMADILNSGVDLHTWFGEQMTGPTSDPKEKKNSRQRAKCSNFGFPGGLGTEKFIWFASKSYGVHLTTAEAQDLKDKWFNAFPEMLDYFNHISRMVREGRPLVHPGSNRVRGDIRFTSAANSYFQGRASDMLKDAGWRLTKACYSGQLQARCWNQAHDEIIVECPEAIGHEVAMAVVSIMEDAGRTWCPGVPVHAEPAIQRVWRKAASPVWRDGRLIPYEDRDLSDTEISTVRESLDKGTDPWYISWEAGISPERVVAL